MRETDVFNVRRAYFWDHAVTFSLHSSRRDPKAGELGLDGFEGLVSASNGLQPVPPFGIRVLALVSASG